MGYDVKVTKTEFRRWFSIWNWHRCLVIAFAGLGLVDDEEVERQLMMVNNLQHSDESVLDPNDEDESRFQITSGNNKDDEKTIIQTQYEFDSDGYIVGGQGIVPIGSHMKVDEKFKRGLFSLLKMQTKTNHLIMDHRETINLDIETAKQLHSMDGEKIPPGECMVLGTGALLGLQLCSSRSLDIMEAFGEMGSDEDVLKLLSDAAVAHLPPFELEELWDEVGAIGSFIGVMFEASGNQSTITIT